MSQAEVIAATGSKPVPAYYRRRNLSIVVVGNARNSVRRAAIVQPKVRLEKRRPRRKPLFRHAPTCSGHPRLAADDEKKHASPQSLRGA